MTKSPPPKGPGKPFKPGFVPQGGFRPTVGLPPSAGGGLPGMAGPGGRPAAPALNEADRRRLLQLGGAHLAAGRLEHAAKAAAAVLQAEPKNPDALHLLGLVALANGAADKAEKMIATAAALMPHHVNVWVNLGNAQRDQGKTDEALISYQRAESINPAYPDIFLNRGQLYKDIARYSEAIEAFERLIALTPGEASGYMRAAAAANDAGLFRETVRYCRRALEPFAEPPVQILTVLAAAHERLGELDEALAIADKVLAGHPSNAPALRVWARAQRRLRKNDPALLRDLRARFESVDAASYSPADGRLFYSELAQICDEAGDTAKAFEYFTLMNAMTDRLPEIRNLDRGKFSGEVDELSKLFTERNLRGMTALPAIGKEAGHSAAPVFLVGFPRSGTTLLDQILDAHPDVQVFEELPLLRSVRNALAAYPKSLLTLDAAGRQALRDVYWEELREAGADLEGKTVVNKMPLDMIHAGLIARVFPEAKFILALRHPADCVLSCFMQDFVPNGAMVNFLTLEGSARLYDSVFTLWQQYRKLLPLDVQEVRYENLVADLRAEVEPVLRFLGLQWNDAVSDPAAHALQRGTIRTPSYSQVTQPIYSSSAERWRRYEAQMKPVLPILAPHIDRLGYSL
ncbi:MAG: sulfotransferase [Parvibaculum sp.]|nr:sulfotransferase [Parvibaculum sp.]